MDKIANMVLSLKDEMIKTLVDFFIHIQRLVLLFFTTAVIADKLQTWL